MKTDRLVVLDGLRGVAALAVVCLHILRIAWWAVPSPAYIAVDFFFLLSGFVIGRTYEARLRAGLSFVRYMGIRLRRLYPSIATGVVLGACLALVARPEQPIALWAVLQLVLLPALGTMLFPLNGVQWSLFFEIIANAVHALLARYLSNVLLGFIILVGLTWLLAETLVFGSMERGFWWSNISGGGARVTFSFFAGLALWRLMAAGRLPTLRLPGWFPVLVLAAILAIPVPTPWLAAHNVVAVIVVFPVLLVVGANANANGRLAAPFSYLGRLSYPLYATHLSLVSAVGPFILEPPLPWPIKAIAAMLVVLASLALADLVERFIERPSRRAFAAQRKEAA